MTSFTVGLYRSKTIISRLIQWQTRGFYSHAALHFEPEGLAYEAWHKGGVQRGPVGHLHEPGTQIDVYSIEAPFDILRTLGYCEDAVGAKYDFRMVARFVTRQKETKGSQEKYFCSELVYNALKAGGLELFANTEGWEVSPDLLKRSPLLRWKEAIIL